MSEVPFFYCCGIKQVCIDYSAEPKKSFPGEEQCMFCGKRFVIKGYGDNTKQG